VTPKHRLKRRPDLNFRAVDHETVILDRASGLIHQLNSTASYLWDQCDGSSTTESIVEGFAQAFEIDSARAERDVIKVLNEMKQLNLLEVVQ
jgi:Coenzyme PQQ synthesis protein D (PqqD)